MVATKILIKTKQWIRFWVARDVTIYAWPQFGGFNRAKHNIFTVESNIESAANFGGVICSTAIGWCTW